MHYVAVGYEWGLVDENLSFAVRGAYKLASISTGPTGPPRATDPRGGYVSRDLWTPGHGPRAIRFEPRTGGRGGPDLLHKHGAEM